MNEMNTTAQPTKRIEYIDALRGFTMTLVVFYHVAFFCWKIIGLGISVHDYLLQVRMPMFFFISGFVLYKAEVVWDARQVYRFLRKKLSVQILAPFIFFLVFIHVNDIPLLEGLIAPTKKGYWFTYVLFEYYIFYVVMRFIFNERWANILLLLLGFILFFINWAPFYHWIPLPESVKGALSMQCWCYFLFFVFGTLAKKNFALVEKLLDSYWLITVCVLFYFLGNFFREYLLFSESISRLLLTTTGLVVLFSFFRKKQDLFSKSTVIGRSLQYVGRRTLDVYLIHYFLIPKSLSFITVFTDHPMPIIEASVSLVITIIIIAGCLLIGNIIRLSPFLAHWAFGAKKVKN